MTLYIIRHLPTEWNARQILQGSTDIPLLPVTPEVQRKIDENLKAIGQIEFDAVLTSELSRAQETARLYGFSDFTPEPLLNELNFGPYEGKPKPHMLAELGDSWTTNVWDCRPLSKQLESFGDRLKKFRRKYAGHDNVLAFSHGAVIRGLLAIDSDGDIARMNQRVVANNEIVIIQVEAASSTQIGSTENSSINSR